MLQSDVIAPEEQCRKQRNYDNGHCALHIHIISYMRALRGHLVRNIQESRKTVKDGMELLKAPALFKFRLQLLYFFQ